MNVVSRKIMLSKKFPKNLTSAKIEIIIKERVWIFTKEYLRRFERLERWGK